MIKQLEQIKQIANELGVIFENDSKCCRCMIKLPSAYYVTNCNFIEDPSSVYVFRYDEKRITDCLCYNNLVFDDENDGKLIWVGNDNYDMTIKTPDYKEIKQTLTECLKDLKAKEEQLKLKNLGKDFE